MAEKILIASGKGGVGKSTFSVFLAKNLAGKDKKVLVIDSDTGLGSLDILFGVPDKVVNSWADVIADGCDAKQAVLEISTNLYLMPSPRFFEGEIPDDIFKNITRQLDDEYDVVIIDASAGIDDNLKRCAYACDRAIFVATADEISVRCAASAAIEVQKHGILYDDMRIVINRYVKKAALKSKLLNIDGVIDKTGISLLGILPEDKKVPFMSVTNDTPSSKSVFIGAVDRIADRMLGKNVPLNFKKFK
ncbi:MAG: AAA family ATPase [Clostridia bacterium]|nr:AAA family ATPase [Clostridia bacterium]